MQGVFTYLMHFSGLDDLDTVAKCVGGQGLAAVCRLLAEDFSGWAGLQLDAPLLIWPETSAAAQSFSLASLHVHKYVVMHISLALTACS